MSITRRIFLRSGALAVVGTAALPASSLAPPSEPPIPAFATSAWSSSSSAAPPTDSTSSSPRRAQLLRHASDHQYSQEVCPRSRRLLRIASRNASFEPLWKQKHLPSSTPPVRPIHALALRRPGLHGIRHARIKVTDDGWLNRTLRDLPADKSAFRAIASDPPCPAFFRAKNPRSPSTTSTTFPSEARIPTPLHVDHFRSHVRPFRRHRPARHRTGNFDAVKTLKAADPAHYTPAANANYPKGRFGDSLKQLAQLIKATSASKSPSPTSEAGSPRQRRQHARSDRQRSRRFLTIHLRLLDRPRRPRRRHRRSHHVRIRTHCPRKTATAAQTTATPTSCSS